MRKKVKNRQHRKGQKQEGRIRTKEGQNSSDAKLVKQQNVKVHILLLFAASIHFQIMKISHLHYITVDTVTKSQMGPKSPTLILLVVGKIKIVILYLKITGKKRMLSCEQGILSY